MKKEVTEMTTLKELEQSIKENKKKNKQSMDDFAADVRKRGMRKGRVRPRADIEKKILRSFRRKK